MSAIRILLVEDDETFRGLLSIELRQRGMVVEAAGTVAAGKAALDRRNHDVALVDLHLPDGSGLDVLGHVKDRGLEVEVILLTAYGAIDSAIEAMRNGAYHYLSKPCPVDEIELNVQKAFEHGDLVRRNTVLRDGFAPPDMGREFVGQSPAFREVLRLIDRVAPTDATVLVLGETGVGKDVVTNRIHALSARRSQPLVVVHCAALNDELLDNELFGHEKGAYTGAGQAKHGLFEVADGGTLFLDEVGDVSQATQVKLLRVLETGRFRRVGGTREIEVDVRILAATNRDLGDRIRRGFFRQDVYYRLNRIRIEVPPLRERREDVPLLAHHFLRRINARFGQDRRFDPACTKRLMSYDWPGNVRELLNVVERAVTLSEDAVLGIEHLPAELRSPPPGRSAQEPGESLPTLEELERRHIERVLRKVGGNRSRAAEILAVSERTLYRKIRRWALDEGPESAG